MINISPARAADLRAHPSAKDTGHGWLILADTNCFTKVILVSKHASKLVSFEYQKPYHSYLRAYCQAKVYAEQHPEVSPPQKSVDLVFAPLFGLTS